MSLPGRLVLLGHPVSQSLSPRFQNAALESAGIPLRYQALDVEPMALPSTLMELRSVRAAGNVTIPHKYDVARACAALTPLAERVGAVNTFWTTDGGLVGDNTDVGGFSAAVVGLLGAPPNGITIGIIGAGGAAAAVLAAVEQWRNCRAIVHNRTADRAERLCARFPSVAQQIDDVRLLAKAQLVVNATSVGLRDDAFPVDPSLLDPSAAVVDLVYRAGETAWVRAARAGGHPAIDGLPMLIEQGALSFERWFGSTADRGVMWQAVVDPSP
jgi:shikimate dehydrogenase